MGYLVWITGLSGSGKTSLAKELLKELKKRDENKTILLDGDVLRTLFLLKKGHTIEDRKELAFSYSKLCHILVSQEINIICSTISLFKEVHEYNRKNFKEYYEIFLDCDINELINRNSKGLYNLKSDKKNIVGLDLPFDKPVNCDLIINNKFDVNIEEYVHQILNLMNK